MDKINRLYPNNEAYLRTTQLMTETIDNTTDSNNGHKILNANYAAAENIPGEIAELKAQLERVRQNEEKLRTLIRISTDIITVIDTEGNILLKAPPLKMYWAIPPARLKGKTRLIIYTKKIKKE